MKVIHREDLEAKEKFKRDLESRIQEGAMDVDMEEEQDEESAMSVDEEEEKRRKQVWCSC